MFSNAISKTLPIIPLYNKVILPSIADELVLSDDEAQRIIHNQNDTIYIFCVPYVIKSHQGMNGYNHDINSSNMSYLFHYGCTARLISFNRAISGTMILKVEGICRSRILDIVTTDGSSCYSLLEHYFDESEKGLERNVAQSFSVTCDRFIDQMKNMGLPSGIVLQFKKMCDDYLPLSHIAYQLLYLSGSSLSERLAVLEGTSLKERIMKTNHTIICHMQTERKIKVLDSQFGNMRSARLAQFRRDFYRLYQNNLLSLKQHSMIMDDDYKVDFKTTFDDDEELLEIIQKLNDANLPSDVIDTLQRDINRVRKLSPTSADSAVIRIYLEWVANLPWSTSTNKNESINISAARAKLDADHFGIDQVKRRILEYLSVIKAKSNATPPVMCFVGPPGVGKTTLARSIASALQRKFHNISLGGVRDEAEIRGHRRTYVGALPGLLIHAMRQCGTQNPVILLDEIDKIVQRTHNGDPSAALLEVLDPAQSSTFTDHFLNLPYDLSKVMFIATANTLDTIPSPLLDRMEVIQLSGYTIDEKLSIAQTYLIPKQIEAHGLSSCALEFSDKVLLRIIELYTHESGVRGLDRVIASICRYKCREYADLEEAKLLADFQNHIDMHDVEMILGAPIYDNEVIESDDVPGIVTGLAYSGSGNGNIMLVKSSIMPGTSKLKLTGSLGDVIKESAEISFSWVKSNAFSLKLTNSPKHDVFKDIDLHIHLPSGAIPKDGPSAGITMVTCVVSLLLGKSVPRTTAMTGEVTLRGQVRPVGGIKEKVNAAHRSGIKKLILPYANRRDVQNEIPQNIIDEITFCFCKSIWEVIEFAFDHTDMKCESRYSSNL